MVLGDPIKDRPSFIMDRAKLAEPLRVDRGRVRKKKTLERFLIFTTEPRTLLTKS
jgi:hypothetical protein